jgi:long-chain acyl-CoA synthetase
MTVSRTFDILNYSHEKYNRADALVSKVDGIWQPVSISSFSNIADHLSFGLMQRGIGPGDKVAIISSNRPEWNFADFAIAGIGAVSVPIYTTMGLPDTAFILDDSKTKIVFVENEELYDKVQSIRDKAPSVQLVFTFNEIQGVPHWKALLEEGRANLQPEKLRAYKDNVKPNDLLTLIYTSGTTGTPKGVMLSHDNIISNIHGSHPACPVTHEHKTLSFLPLSHIFERMLVYLYLYVGAGIYYAESLETIGENLKEVKPFCFSTVPRLLEKVFDKIVAKGNELTGIKKKLFFWALDLGLKYEFDGANGPWYELQLSIANKLIFKKWREALGGQIGLIVSGSAALQPRLARVFTAAGINVLEGYGLTETSPVISVNRIDKGLRKFGTVGTVIQGVEVKIADDGEILCKGPNVMLGYYKRQEETAEVMKDGWFHTGDIGMFEDGKFLKITDRKKEIFKTSGGKYIAPQQMENKFKESVYIEQIMVLGENQRFPAALIVPDFSGLRGWAARQEGIPPGFTNAELIAIPAVQALFQSEVDHYNEAFGSYERIKKFYLVPEEWSIQSGELTPSMKLKRRVLHEKYAAQIDAFYKEA